jgi:hypothetical protein
MQMTIQSKTKLYFIIFALIININIQFIICQWFNALTKAELEEFEQATSLNLNLEQGIFLLLIHFVLVELI